MTYPIFFQFFFNFFQMTANFIYSQFAIVECYLYWSYIFIEISQFQNSEILFFPGDVDSTSISSISFIK